MCVSGMPAGPVRMAVTRDMRMSFRAFVRIFGALLPFLGAHREPSLLYKPAGHACFLVLVRHFDTLSLRIN